jgi:fatty acid desaturase
MNQRPQRTTSQDSQLEQQREFYVQARGMVADLFQPNPRLFWTDFIVSTVAAYVLASLWLALPMTSAVSWFAFVSGGVLLYRASMFIHELVHLPASQMKWFRRTWNFFAGVPMMVPSFSYTSHLHHHSSRHYGTEEDGEYLPLAHGSLKDILIFLTQVVSQPVLVFLRYAIGTPVSFLHPALRKWTLTHASSLVINFQYQKDLKPHGQSSSDTFWELFTCFRAWVMLALVLCGVMPFVRLPKIFMLAVFALTLNHIRTLAAHRYTSDGETISHLDQFLDSTNVTGNWLTELLCPLGLRYHALHHLFPRIPYHNLGIAHRRLTEQLPADSVYHEATYPSISSAINDLLKNVREYEESQTA